MCPVMEIVTFIPRRRTYDLRIDNIQAAVSACVCVCARTRVLVQETPLLKSTHMFPSY